MGGGGGGGRLQKEVGEMNRKAGEGNGLKGWEEREERGNTNSGAVRGREVWEAKLSTGEGREKGKKERGDNGEGNKQLHRRWGVGGGGGDR